MNKFIEIEVIIKNEFYIECINVSNIIGFFQHSINKDICSLTIKIDTCNTIDINETYEHFRKRLNCLMSGDKGIGRLGE